MSRNNQQKSLQNEFRGILKYWAVPFGCGFLFLFLMKYVFFVGYAQSASMEPTIRENTIIIGIRFIGEPVHGDVVIFKHFGKLLIKRISALPGDAVIKGDETLYVPDNCYYMLGDNTEASVDSRYWNEPL